jgi:hypothetical protein
MQAHTSAHSTSPLATDGRTSFRLDEMPEEFAICPAVPALATEFCCNKPTELR